MTGGAYELQKKYGGSSLAVAEALLRGEIAACQANFVNEIVSMVILEAAKFRVEHAGKGFLKPRQPAEKKAREY